MSAQERLDRLMTAYYAAIHFGGNSITAQIYAQASDLYFSSVPNSRAR